MNRVNLASSACLQLAIATVALCAPAAAATRIIGNSSNAAGICQGALPAFDGLIRKRPLAVQNEAVSDAFVTCAFTQSNAGNGPATMAYLYAKSNDGVAHTVSCTAVTGYATGINQYVTKTVTTAANGSQAEMLWTPSDFTGSTTNLPSVLLSISCLLPPGSGLNDTYIDTVIDVGT